MDIQAESLDEDIEEASIEAEQPSRRNKNRFSENQN